MTQKLIEFSGAVKVVVPISGGKDSQCCLKLARENYPAHEIRGLFCDTNFEHPITCAHIENLKKLYGVRIDKVNVGTVEEKILKYGRFPSDQARFCTDELKIIPTKLYCKALAIEQGGFEVWYGMRSDESPQRTKRYAGKVGDDVYQPNEVLKKYPKYLGKLGVLFRLPILEWNKEDVFEYLNGEENPLYKIMLPNGERKFDRVGCFPCQAAGDKAKESAYQHDEFGAKQLATITYLSAKIGRSQWNSKGGKARNDGAGCAVCSI